MAWSRSELTQVIQRYAPFVYFHPNEALLPSSVEWFLARSALISSNGLKLLHPTVNALPQSAQPSESAYSTLGTHGVLKVGKYLVSPQRKFFLVMQSNGNLCIYRGSSPEDQHELIWASMTAGSYQPGPGPYFAVMQGDGNFCIYKGTDRGDYRGLVFGTVQTGGYAPQSGEYFAAIQDDGNFGVYRGAGRTATLVWSTGITYWLDIDPNYRDTSGDWRGSVLHTAGVLSAGQYLVSGAELYFLIMQGDGNLCVYRGSGPSDNQGVVWGSMQRAGYQPLSGPCYTVMQGDGNLCIYKGSPNDSGGFVFGTAQVGGYAPTSGEYFTAMQDDGNFCIYRGTGPADNHGLVWATGPDRSGHAVDKLARAKAYVHARAAGDYVDLQFYLFYPYNGAATAYLSLDGIQNVDLSPLGRHKGDWEYVVLRVDTASKALRSVYLSQHAAGEWITDLSKLERHNEQVVIYASQNGHAAFPHSGDNPTQRRSEELVHGTFDFYLVNATAQGRSLDCSARYELIADFLDMKEPAWLDFPYRWGPDEHEEQSVSQAVSIAGDALKALMQADLFLLLFLSGLTQVITGALLEFAKLDESGPTGPKQKGAWTGGE